MTRSYYVYIAANNAGTLYIGVTNDLQRRIEEHKQGAVPGFTQKYIIKKLVYFEESCRIDDAIAREKQLKNWHRDWKLNLIRAANPDLRDLYCHPELGSGSGFRNKFGMTQVNGSTFERSEN